MTSFLLFPRSVYFSISAPFFSHIFFSSPCCNAHVDMRKTCSKKDPPYCRLGILTAATPKMNVNYLIWPVSNGWGSALEATAGAVVMCRQPNSRKW